MLKVVSAPDEKLRIKTKPVKRVTPALLKIAQEMVKLTKTYTEPEGVGLASTQVGRNEAMFVAKIDNGKVQTKSKESQKWNFEVFFNPKIISYGPKTKTFFEGCLSIPNYFGETIRPTIIKVSYIDKSGQEIKKTLRGLPAWVFQHEVEHLDGKLFVDKVLSQKGRMFKVAGKDRAGNDIFKEVILT
ncbi:peptide deformylase [Candidatus Daviesbacteria bacterium]|nr:peptide deformylase [Candidatus Daviesbacteria bacterium]